MATRKLSKPPAKKKPQAPLVPTVWHGVLWAVAGLVVLTLVLFWYSGVLEGREALQQGRRMTITLSTGEIKGRKIDNPSEAKRAETVIVADGETIPVAATSDALGDINQQLLEKTEYGMLPAISPDGTKSWRYYSRPFDHRGGRPMIAIIVTGVGQNKANSSAALRLPVDMTISLSPYARDADKWAIAARASGHEVMFDLPMQSSDYPATDPGPYGLLITQTSELNTRNLRTIMGRAAGYTGFAMPQNEVYSGDNDAFKILLQGLGNHGLMLVVGREPHKNETREILDASSTPNVVADMWIDEEPSVTGIQTRLATLEQTARKRGYAIGMAQALPISIEQLTQWSALLAAKGIVLVPVTFIAKPRFS